MLNIAHAPPWRVPACVIGRIRLVRGQRPLRLLRICEDGGPVEIKLESALDRRRGGQLNLTHLLAMVSSIYIPFSAA